MYSQATIPVHALLEAARRADVVAAMDAFYHRADQLIAAQPATCWNHGLCCRFGAYGHRLYVTALEAAYYLAAHGPPPPAVEDACPHASGGRCHVREIRPLGCRIFFCDPAAAGWQGPLTERLLGELREMHDRLGVAYFYADWMIVLSAVAAANGAPLPHPAERAPAPAAHPAASTALGVAGSNLTGAHPPAPPGPKKISLFVRPNA